MYTGGNYDTSEIFSSEQNKPQGVKAALKDCKKLKRNPLEKSGANEKLLLELIVYIQNITCIVYMLGLITRFIYLISLPHKWHRSRHELMDCIWATIINHKTFLLNILNKFTLCLTIATGRIEGI